MAEDEILFDDVYTLGDVVGKYVYLRTNTVCVSVGFYAAIIQFIIKFVEVIFSFSSHHYQKHCRFLEKPSCRDEILSIFLFVREHGPRLLMKTSKLVICILYY